MFNPFSTNECKAHIIEKNKPHITSEWQIIEKNLRIASELLVGKIAINLVGSETRITTYFPSSGLLFIMWPRKDVRMRQWDVQRTSPEYWVCPIIDSYCLISMEKRTGKQTCRMQINKKASFGMSKLIFIYVASRNC